MAGAVVRRRPAAGSAVHRGSLMIRGRSLALLVLSCLLAYGTGIPCMSGGSIVPGMDCPPPPPSSPSHAPRSPPPPINTCFIDRGWGDTGVGFRGSVAVTASFRKCQPWRRQYPHKWSTNYPLELGTDTPYVSNYCRNVEPPTSATGSTEEAQLGPWCYTQDPEVRWEVCQVCNKPLRLLEPVQAPHQHGHVPHWLGPLMFAFSICALATVLAIGAVRYFEIDVAKYFDVFGQDVTGRVVRMTRPRPRAAPLVTGGGGGGGNGGVPSAVGSSLSLPSCGGTSPLVASPASGAGGRNTAAARVRANEEATFGALAGLASFQQQRNATSNLEPVRNPMAPGGAEQRRAAGQGLLANDSAAAFNAPPLLGPDTTASGSSNRMGDHDV